MFAVIRIGWCLPLALAALPGAARADGPGSRAHPDRLAARAREVLARHCAGCHSGAKARAGLDILDTAQLRQRGLIDPQAAESSELIELVRSGAMPPGTHRKVAAADRDALRDWIAAGAPAESTSSYIARHLLADWNDLPAAKRPLARYLSLAHLEASPGGREQLTAARAELSRLLGYYTSPKSPSPARAVAVDPARLVFRIDLAALGWDLRPFRQSDPPFAGEQPVRESPSPVHLFDLFLLEYPYGALDFSAPDFAGLRQYLGEAAGVRPVPWVRGDWLLGQLAAGPLRDELALLLGVRGPKPESAAGLRFREGTVTPAEARAELGWAGDEAALNRALRDEPGVAGLAAGKPVPRAAWERAFPALLRRLGGATPILPLDGLDAPGCLLDRASPELKLETTDGANNRKSTFRPPQEKLAFRMSAREDVVYEFFWKVARGYHPLGLDELAAGKEHREKDWDIAEEVGTEHLVMFAFPKSVVKKAADFPRGLLLRAPDHPEVRARYVHPLYRIRKDGKGFEGPDAEKMLAAKATFKIVR